MKTDVKSEIEGLKGLLVEANARIAKLEEQADAPASCEHLVGLGVNHG